MRRSARLTSIFRAHEVAGCGTGQGLDSSVRSCLAARLSRRVGGVPQAQVLSFPVVRAVPAGQPDGMACSRAIAAVIPAAQGQFCARRRRRRRLPRTIRPATENRRSRSRFGSQRRASPVRASIWVQARSSQARATISHHSWFWAKPLSGRFRSPVSLAHRIRSSHRARCRCRSSRTASWPFLASVAKAVNRCPSMSVNRSCAPGCGRSLRTMTRIPPGQLSRSSSPVMSATHAPSRTCPSPS